MMPCVRLINSTAMSKQSIWHQIELAMKHDKKQRPQWPDHAAGQAGKVARASGVLMAEAMEFKYQDYEVAQNDDVMKERMRVAAVQTAVMAIRFLENL